MKKVKRCSGETPRVVSLKTSIISGVCIAALLFGTIAQSMPAFAQQSDGYVHDVHPLHTDLISKQYTYDANGNHIGTTSPAGNESKEYDVLDRLIRYEGPEGVEEYTYFGISPKKRSVKRTSAGSTTSELTTFLYDGDNVIAEYTGEDYQLSKLYVTPELDQNLSMTVASGPDAGTYYYSQDVQGSARTLTDATGVARSRYDYTAFGEPVNSTETVSQRYGFTGREHSSESGGLCYRHRNYNPLLGRFDGSDPAGYDYNMQGNLYAYANNQPT